MTGQSPIDPHLLEEILAKESLFTHFQPICSIRTKTVIGVEALCRGIHPQSGEVLSPAPLFEAAARSGDALVVLDRLARRKALEAFRALCKNGGGPAVFLNLDAGIIDRGVLGSGKLRDLAEELEIHPGNVVIEIIESRVSETADLERFAATYKEMGFLVALDDVGSGHSNLERVALLQPDILKIDRSLVNGVSTGHYKREVFRAISTLGHRIGAMVVAEGVEHEEDLLAALDLGADFIQGYYLARPASADEPELGRAAGKAAHLADRFREHVEMRIRAEQAAEQVHAQVLDEILAGLVWDFGRNLNACLEALANRFRGVECLYVLDANGVQISDTVFARHLAPMEQRFIFHAAAAGADHSLKKFFLGLKPGREKYLTGPYISLASGRLCRTYSAIAGGDGRRCVLCVDFEASNSEPAASR